MNRTIAALSHEFLPTSPAPLSIRLLLPSASARAPETARACRRPHAASGAAACELARAPRPPR
eukprot:6200386-Pleurochrysis_carterae.AAC.2